MRIEPRPVAETPLFPDALPALPVQQPFVFDRIIGIINERMDRQDARLERLQATQFTVCEQLKDVRANLPMQRRPLSSWVQRIHIETLNAKRGGLCPCCEEAAVCTAAGRLPGAEYDHWFARNRARAEETWLVCSNCNARLNDTEFKASVRSAFESYQLALRRILQTRQASLIDGRKSAAS